MSNKFYSKTNLREERRDNHRYKATKMKLPYINTSINDKPMPPKQAWEHWRTKESISRTSNEIYPPSSNKKNDSGKIILMK